MEREIEKCIKIYNGGQDEYEVKNICIHFDGFVYLRKLKNDKIPKNHKALLDHEQISFYEWLGNRDYRVLEVFEIKSANDIMRRDKKGILYFKQPEEIIKYLIKE